MPGQTSGKTEASIGKNFDDIVFNKDLNVNGLTVAQACLQFAPTLARRIKHPNTVLTKRHLSERSDLHSRFFTDQKAEIHRQT